MQRNLYSFKSWNIVELTILQCCPLLELKLTENILCAHADCSDYIRKKYKGTRVTYNVISNIFALHILVLIYL